MNKVDTLKSLCYTKSMQPFITCEETKTHAIKPGDPNFMIQGKFTMTPRASLNVTHKCPIEYSLIIQKCFQKGWINLEANITEREKIFMGLTNDQ